MITIAGYIIFGILSLLAVVTVLNIVAGPVLKNAPGLQTQPRVSVLIPARNEEHNIERCVRSMMRQEYDNFEIIALDDNSTDRTMEILHDLRDEYPGLRILPGKELPEGWTGKNWACNQLSAAADGDIFIFTDADNWHEPSAIRNTVAWMQQYELDLFSAFPQQETVTAGEKLIVPIIDLILYGCLPLWLTYYTSSPLLAAANGQWIALPAGSYRELGGHAAIRMEVVEDTAMARRAKQNGMKTLTAAGTGAVFARMYRNFRQVWEGMSKILFGLMDYKPVPFLSVLGIFFAIGVLPYFLVWMPEYRLFAAVVIGINILLRLLFALKYKHPVLLSTLLHPVSLLLGICIGMNSIRQAYTGTTLWKDREIDVRDLIVRAQKK